MKNLTAKDIMNPQVVWAPESFTVREAAALFSEKKISGAPVVDAEGNMIGVVSLKDIALTALRRPTVNSSQKDASYYTQGWETPLTEEEIDALQAEVNREQRVSDIMTPMAFTVKEDSPLKEITEIFLVSQIHRVVVTDGEELKGIVTTTDILRALRDWL